MGAHPPCSRKGPLLPACGLKRPRRVKRETTNSRFFFRFKGTWSKFWVVHPPTSPTTSGGRQSESSLNRVASERGGNPRDVPRSALKGWPVPRALRSPPAHRARGLPGVGKKRNRATPDPHGVFPKPPMGGPLPPPPGHKRGGAGGFLRAHRAERGFASLVHRWAMLVARSS